MKKISEVAEELDCSRQTIYNWIDRMDQTLKPHIDRSGKALTIDNEGIKEIEKAINQSKGFDNTSPRGKELQKRIEELESRLEEKDKQIQWLRQQLDKKNELLENFQVMLQTERMANKQLEGEVQQEQQPGLIERIKNIFSSSES